MEPERHEHRRHAPWGAGVARHLAGGVLGFALAALGTGLVAEHLGATLPAITKSEKAALQLLAYRATEPAPDVVVIGSSAVEKGLDPIFATERLTAALGRPAVVHDLGLAGLRTTFLAAVIEDVILPRPPRELLVIAIENRSFCRAVTGGVRREQLEGEWLVQQEVRDRLRFVDGLRTLWRLPQLYSAESRGRVRALAEAQGADAAKTLDWTPEAERRRAIAVEAEPTLEEPEPIAWEWCDAGSIEHVDWRRVLELLERLDVPVLVVKMPFEEGFEEREMPGTTARFEAEVLAELERRGIAFEDLNRDPFPRRPIAFFDGFHLTKRGRRTTTKHLVDEVLLPRLR